MPALTVATENDAPIDIHYEDHGRGQPIVLIHGYPLNGNSWERQERELLAHGHRVITYDRRGFGHSSQPTVGYDYDTFAADLHALIEHLDLANVVLVGFSMGTGEVTRYLATYGSKRVRKAALLGTIPPFVLKTDDNPEGVDGKVFDDIKAAVANDRYAFFEDFLNNFNNVDVLGGTRISDRAWQASFNVASGSSPFASYACVDTWLTDFRTDLPKIDVPVLVMHGTEDRILPFDATAARLPALIADCTLVPVEGGPHNIGWTHADEVTAALLAVPQVNEEALMNTTTKIAQVRLDRVTPARWRVVLDNPPLNLMGPEFVSQMRETVTALENDDRVKVVVFESAVEGFFLNHSDFLADFDELTSIPQGPTGLEAWPDILVRLTRAPFVSIALIRGRATGNGSELALACDMSFASRERAVLSQWEVGVGLVAGGGPMARLPRLIGRGRALEVLLSSDDISGADAERFGYVNRALPDVELDTFVAALATRIASFDKWAIANTKRLVNEASLPPDVEIRAGWDACMNSVKRAAAQHNITALLERGLQQPGDVQDRLGFHLGQLEGSA